MYDLAEDMQDIVTAPFGGPFDLKHLALLCGLVLVISVAWVFVLEHIRTAAMEIIE